MHFLVYELYRYRNARYKDKTKNLCRNLRDILNEILVDGELQIGYKGQLSHIKLMELVCLLYLPSVT